MTKPISISIPKCFIALLLCVLLTACDGGIFGTGDGSNGGFIPDGTADSPVDVIPPLEQETPATTPPETPVQPTDPVGEPPTNATDEAAPPSVAPISDLDTTESITDFDPVVDVTVSSAASTSFSNSIVVTAEGIPELQFINLTGTSVGIFPDSDVASASIAATSSTSFIDNGEVPVNTSMLLIDAINSAGERSTLVTIDPATLATGSRTLVVLRRLQPTADIIVLPFATGVVDDDQVAVRIVSAALIGDPEVPSTFTLESTFDPIAATTFDPVTFSQPVTDYLLFNTGSFTLTDSAARFSDLALDLELPGAVVTIVLDPSLPDQHVILVDNP